MGTPIMPWYNKNCLQQKLKTFEKRPKKTKQPFKGNCGPWEAVLCYKWGLVQYVLGQDWSGSGDGGVWVSFLVCWGVCVGELMEQEVFYMLALYFALNALQNIDVKWTGWLWNVCEHKNLYACVSAGDWVGVIDVKVVSRTTSSLSEKKIMPWYQKNGFGSSFVCPFFHRASTKLGRYWKLLCQLKMFAKNFFFIFLLKNKNKQVPWEKQKFIRIFYQHIKLGRMNEWMNEMLISL